VSSGGQPDEKEEYMKWLERMWDVQRFDIPGRTEREEARTEEVLKVFQGLGELARSHVEPPIAPCWEATRERSLASDDGPEQDRPEQDRCELEAAGWKRLKRSDGQEVWVEPDKGLMYQQVVGLAKIRKVTGYEANN
jgi:hypothetical protein